MKRKKLLAVMAGVMSLSIVLSACGSKQAKNPGKEQDLASQTTDVIKASNPEKNPDVAKNRKDTLVVGVDAPEGVFNPLYNESAYDMYIAESIFDGMMDLDAQGNPIPGIAEKWDLSKDGLTYTFHLRKDAKFNDGSPLTADDVAFTYTVVCDPQYTGVIDASTIGLKGFKDFNEGNAATVEGIKVVDKNTIEFVLDKPNSSAIYTLGAGILPKAYYGKDYKKGDLKALEALHNKPMGAGKYKFVSFKPGQEVDLVANENYWQGKPKIPNLIFKVTTEDTRIQQLTTGEIDIDMVTVNPENIEQLKGAGFIDLQLFPTNGYGYVGMNIKDAKFTDKKVRQALAYGLNRKQVGDTVYKGYSNAINIPASKVSWTFTEEGINKYEYNTEKANQLLDEAGWKKGADGIREKDGKKFEIHFLASSPNPVNDALIPIAKQDFEKLGIKFIPEAMEFNAVRDRVTKGNFEMFFMAWGLTADPDQTNVFGTKASQNKTFYSNPELDKLLADGLRESDKEKRKKIYAEAYKVINEDVPYLFIYQRKDMWVINSRIKNINTTPYKDFTFDLHKAEIK